MSLDYTDLLGECLCYWATRK